MMYVGTGPRAREYRYVILDNASSRNIIDFEPFTREGIRSADETYNEVYGRSWNRLHLPELPQVYSFFNKHDERDPADSKLFEEGQIATLHIRADEDEVQGMHANKLQKGEKNGEKKDEKVHASMTYIGYAMSTEVRNLSHSFSATTRSSTLTTCRSRLVGIRAANGPRCHTRSRYQSPAHPMDCIAVGSSSCDPRQRTRP